MEKVIIRSSTAGVFFGTLVNHSQQTKTVVMENARRVWRWAGAASISQLSVDGTSNPQECKFPCAVEKITVADVIEVIPMTPKAVKSLEEVPIWRE